MINLENIKQQAEWNGLPYELLDGLEMWDTKRTIKKVKVWSEEHTRSIVFYEWFERPYTGIKDKGLKKFNDVPNSIPTINAEYTENNNLVILDRELRYRLNIKTMVHAFNWLNNKKIPYLETMDRIPLHQNSLSNYRET